jgi:hypothetical protein
MEKKLFEQHGKNFFKLLKENENEETPIYIDRHGSMPDRPKDIKFKTPEDYSDHMGFDAALPDDVSVSPEQIKTVKALMKKGYKITGHSKWGDDPTKIEILMTLHTRTGSRFADVAPDGKIL